MTRPSASGQGTGSKGQANASDRARRRRRLAVERARGAKVLVCEPSPRSPQALGRSISALGYAVTASPSPDDALRKVAKASPDVIVAVIPEHSQESASMLLLLRRAAPTTPLVIVAENATLELRARCQPLRPYYFAIPPIPTSELSTIIQGAIASNAPRS